MFQIPAGALAAGIPATNQKSGTVEMTLQEAINYAKDNNKDLKDLKDTCKNTLTSLNDMKTRTQNMQNIANPHFGDNSPTDTVGTQYALWKGYTLTNTQQGYNELLKSKDLTEQIVSYNIEKLTYQLQEMGQSLDYQRKSKTKVEKDLVIANLKLKLKMIEKTQVDTVNNALNQINTGIKTTYDALTAQKNALKTLLGIDRSVTLKIKQVSNEVKPIGEVTINDLESKAAENRLDAIKLTDTLNTKKMDFDVYDNLKANIAYDTYKDKLDAYNKEKDNYDNAMDDIRQKVDTVYQAVLSSEEQYNNAVQAFNIASENYRVSKLKFSLGMISQVDLMNSELANMKAEQDKDKALDNNIFANRKFVASYMIGDLETAAQ
jgi:outer membrane protein TolC